MRGSCSGSLASVTAFRVVHRPGVRRDAVTAIWTLPGKTPRSRAALAVRAHLVRVSNPAAQMSSATPLV
jgi:hypothetical protein